MCILTKNQIIVLKHFRKGKKPSEIRKIENMSLSSVYEAIKRGRQNISRAIETLQVATNEKLLEEYQIRDLKAGILK
jgi:transcriptional regulator